MTTTQAVCDYTAFAVGLTSNAALAAEMKPPEQGGTGPEAPFDFLYSMGVYVKSDITTTPAGKAVRELTLALVPSVPGLVTSTVDITASGGPVTALALLNRGKDYAAPPVVEFVGGGEGGGAPAKVASAKTSLRVNSVNVTSGGTGYTTPTVKAIGGLAPDGTPATLTATVVLGVITAINVVDPGSGYFAPPTIVITGTSTTPAFATSSMELDQVILLSGGSGYVGPPTVNLVPLFKYIWPDGASDQRQPFYNLITGGLVSSTASKILAADPVIT